MDAIRNDVGHLRIGVRYRVVRAFTDYDGALHPVRETWRFGGAAFLPYEDGYTFYVSADGVNETSFRMQERPEAQGEFFADTAAYLLAVRPGPPPLASAITAGAVSTAAALAAAAASAARSTRGSRARTVPASTPAGTVSHAGDRAVATAPLAPSRLSLSALRERRRAARTRYQAAGRRLRLDPPMWLILGSFPAAALVILYGFQAHARDEEISFGRYGVYNDYPWWSAVIYGAVWLVAAIDGLVRKLTRHRGQRVDRPS
ncbi:DUF3601 domain-containing protein [Sphingomonas bacterium]|uniref:DUF3601 domain-containing protein n=1 Tax=Sphingomonas bacterium TaxID=1895847 RepID=UPI001576FB14|nr:DUF3601 domain-containing protein [Sphingomonas bacterium]